MKDCSFQIPFLQFFEYETKVLEDALSGERHTFQCKTTLRKDPYYTTIYVFWSKVIFMEFIPYAIIITLNGCIGYTILKSSKFRQQFEMKPLSKVSRQENQIEHLHANASSCEFHGDQILQGWRQENQMELLNENEFCHEVHGEQIQIDQNEGIKNEKIA